MAKRKNKNKTPVVTDIIEEGIMPKKIKVNLDEEIQNKEVQVPKIENTLISKINFISVPRASYAGLNGDFRENDVFKFQSKPYFIQILRNQLNKVLTESTLIGYGFRESDIPEYKQFCETVYKHFRKMK